MDWEGIIIADIMDDVFFQVVFFIVKLVCVQSVVQESNSGVFLLCGVVGCIRDDSVSEGGFSVDESFYVIFEFCGWKCLSSLMCCFVLFLL